MDFFSFHFTRLCLECSFFSPLILSLFGRLYVNLHHLIPLSISLPTLFTVPTTTSPCHFILNLSLNFREGDGLMDQSHLVPQNPTVSAYHQTSWPLRYPVVHHGTWINPVVVVCFGLGRTAFLLVWSR